MKPRSLDVLIVSPEADIHSLTVANRLIRCGYAVSITDTRWLDDRELVSNLGKNLYPSFRFGDVTISSKTSVWWRRPKSPSCSYEPREATVKNFVASQKRMALFGLLNTASSHIINDPQLEQAAEYKSLQLSTAMKCDLTIPETCITNSFDEATAFIDALQAQGAECIFKPLAPPSDRMAETRIINKANLKAEELEIAPAIFQRCVQKGHDIRVFLAGEHLFAAGVVTQHSELVDWRLDPLVEYTETILPEQLASKCQQLLALLGLQSGSIDIRIDHNGVPVFLEINPSGQFLFMQTDLNYAVAEAMAQVLTQRNGPCNLHGCAGHRKERGVKSLSVKVGAKNRSKKT